MNSDADGEHPSVLATAGSYVCWLALSAVALLILLNVRTSLMEMMLRMRADYRLAAAIQDWGLVFLGLGWLGFVTWLEAYLRSGLEQRQWCRRGLRVIVIDVALWGVTYGLAQVLS